MRWKRRRSIAARVVAAAAVVVPVALGASLAVVVPAPAPASASPAPTPAATVPARRSLPLVGDLGARARTAQRAGAAGILPPAHPPANIPLQPNPYLVCGQPFDTSSACTADFVAAIDHARSLEGIGPVHLPTNWSTLTPPQQLLVIYDIERVDRGLPPIVGLTNELGWAVYAALLANRDPSPPSSVNPADTWGGTRYFGFPNALAVDYSMLYSDGLHGDNQGCVQATSADCWAHRDAILGSYHHHLTVGLFAVVGRTDGLGDWGLLLLDDSRPDPPPLSFAWAQELPAVSGPPVVSALSGNTGAGSGGTTMTISGRNLLEVTSVDVGGFAAHDLQVNPTGTSLTAVDPGGSTTQAVAVTLRSWGGSVRAGTFVHQATVPAAPTNVSAVALGGGRIELSWTPEPSGGAPLSGYTVSATGVAPGFAPVTAPASASSVTISGLHTLATYRLHLVSSSSIGPSADVSVGDVVQSPPTPGGAYAIAAYTDFLQRPPSSAELASKAPDLDDGATTHSALVQALASSPEWLTTIVQRLYVDTLGRPADADGAAYWVGQIQHGAQSVAQVAASFYASPEYYTGIGGGTASSWIADLYRKLLGRVPDPSGSAYWVGQVALTGRTSVPLRFYQSGESARARVTALYQTLLGRGPDAAGLAYWAKQVVTSGDVALAASLASSDEYAHRAERRFGPVTRVLVRTWGADAAGPAVDAARHLAYVAMDTGVVSVYDLATGAQIATINVGGTPSHAALSPDGGHLYLSDAKGGVVVDVNTTSRTVARRIPVDLDPTLDGGPAQTVVLGNGHLLVSTGGFGRGRVLDLDLTTASLTPVLAAPVSGLVLAATPDRAHVFMVDDESGGQGLVYDPATKALSSPVEVPFASYGLAAAGGRLLVDGRAVYDSSFSPVANVTLTPPDFPTGAAALTNDGARAYVLGGGSIWAVDAATGAGLGSVQPGGFAVGISARIDAMTMSSDGKELVATPDDYLVILPIS